MTPELKNLLFCLVSLLLLWIGVSEGTGAGISKVNLTNQSLSQSQKTPEEVEYKVKAAFIYNFMKFTEWPKKKMDPPSEDRKSSLKHPMVIGIVGDNPFGKAFDPLLGKKIKERSLQLVYIPGLAKYLKDESDHSQGVLKYFKEHKKSLHSCHVLFFCKSEKKVITEHIRNVKETSILTIGDMENFVEQKGIIGFVKENNKIRFEVHLTQAEHQQLKISSQLLKLARKVIQEKDKNDK